MDVRKNYSLMDTVNSLKLALRDCGYAILDTEWRCKQTCVPYNKLYLIESGEGILYTDKQRVVMKPGVVYLIPAGHTYGYYCDDSLRKLYFHVNLCKSDGSDLLQGVDRIMELPLPRSWMEILVGSYRGCSFTDALTVREYLYKIINEFDREYAIAMGSGPKRSEHVADTILYIQDHLRANMQVDELAQRRFVSKTYLEKQFRKEIGMSIGRYIDEQLMLTAKWWLEQTSRSVADISQKLGYQDPCYFSRRFKQLQGMTPLQYRKTKHPQ